MALKIEKEAVKLHQQKYNDKNCTNLAFIKVMKKKKHSRFVVMDLEKIILSLDIMLVSYIIKTVTK